ncbi:MAG: hypothetical protein ACFFD4_15340 [Candidatus Odinarchaeota archaeon]
MITMNDDTTKNGILANEIVKILETEPRRGSTVHELVELLDISALELSIHPGKLLSLKRVRLELPSFEDRHKV